MASSNYPEHDASGSGQRFEIDLTRQDIRSGTLLLPRSMLAVFEAGPIALDDPARERKHTLTYAPPRNLSGLGTFIDDHGLQPNDKLIFVLDDDGGELLARKRPPKKRPKLEEPPILETDPIPAPAAPEPAPQAAAEAPEPSESGWVVREVRRTPHAGPPPSRQEPPPARPVAEAMPERQAPQQPRQQPPAQQQRPTQRPQQPAYGEVVEARVEHQHPPEPAPLPRTPPPSAEEALALVRAHIAAPDTPAIVNLKDVAGALQIADEAAWHALERLTREPDSGVSLIRQDFYRVSRQAQPKTG